MRDALIAMNRLVSTGVIPSYAIGGAVGASFYIEAAATEDLDVFTVVDTTGLLWSLTPIYDALKALGGVVENEHVVIGGWKVQILPPYKPLVEEALSAAMETEYAGVPTRVMTAEHLCAIALDTGRPKDFLRVEMFIEQGEVNIQELDSIVLRYHLSDKRAKVKNWPGSDDGQHAGCS